MAPSVVLGEEDRELHDDRLQRALEGVAADGDHHRVARVGVGAALHGVVVDVEEAENLVVASGEVDGDLVLPERVRVGDVDVVEAEVGQGLGAVVGAEQGDVLGAEDAAVDATVEGRFEVGAASDRARRSEGEQEAALVGTLLDRARLPRLSGALGDVDGAQQRDEVGVLEEVGRGLDEVGDAEHAAAALGDDLHHAPALGVLVVEGGREAQAAAGRSRLLRVHVVDHAQHVLLELLTGDVGRGRLGHLHAAPVDGDDLEADVDHLERVLRRDRESQPVVGEELEVAEVLLGALADPLGAPREEVEFVAAEGEPHRAGHRLEGLPLLRRGVDLPGLQGRLGVLGRQSQGRSALLVDEHAEMQGAALGRAHLVVEVPRREVGLALGPERVGARERRTDGVDPHAADLEADRHLRDHARLGGVVEALGGRDGEGGDQLVGCALILEHGQRQPGVELRAVVAIAGRRLLAEEPASEDLEGFAVDAPLEAERDVLDGVGLRPQRGGHGLALLKAGWRDRWRTADQPQAQRTSQERARRRVTHRCVPRAFGPEPGPARLATHLTALLSRAARGAAQLEWTKDAGVRQRGQGCVAAGRPGP